MLAFKTSRLLRTTKCNISAESLILPFKLGFLSFHPFAVMPNKATL